jgi:SAM-dependent methyltransferase
MRDDLKTFDRKYSAAMSEHGVTPQGVLWPNAGDLAMRFEVLTGLLGLDQYSAEHKMKLLDLGCGPGFLLDWLALNGLLDRVDYTGVDVLESTIAPARRRWPDHRFELRDVRDQPFGLDMFDGCIICGIFTGRFENSYERTVALAHDTLRAIWPSVTKSLAFNAMSKHVDWERDDLFHWPLDDLVAFCKANLSRHIALRQDYGLWETSALVQKAPVPRRSAMPPAWLAETLKQP